VLVFICAKGVRSLAAAKLADRFGYDRVYNLEGGTKEWARSGLDLIIDSRVAA
jgi:rhodanese-related sulfurtransferase